MFPTKLVLFYFWWLGADRLASKQAKVTQLAATTLYGSGVGCFVKIANRAIRKSKLMLADL